MRDPRFIGFFAFFIVPLFIIVSPLPPVPAHAACESIARPESAAEGRPVVEPARPLKSAGDPLKVVVVLLREYLSYGKKPKKSASVRVDVTPDDRSRSQFRAIINLGDKRLEAPFSFPETLNTTLLGLIEELTLEMKAPIKSKKLLPFLNETSSATSYLRYADGDFLLNGEGPLTLADAERAAAAFEDAVKSDYNYVAAYAGLAEAQAALAVLTGSQPLGARAQGTMEKAKLLNPHRAKIREERYNYYRKGRCPKTEEGQ